MNKSLIKVFNIYIFAFAFLFASRPINDADFWFHMKTGEYFFTTGGVPRMEMYSFTYHGIPWVAHGWLSGVLFYGLSLIHISEPTRLLSISYAVFCLKKKKDILGQ